MSLNYFLNKKIVSEIERIQEEQFLFSVNFPLSIGQKMNFEPMKELQSDMYLTNYFEAYTTPNNSLLKSLALTNNIASLMFLESLAEGTSLISIHNMIRKIENGYKPKTKKEKLALNLIEAIRLVKKPNFEINEDNFELLIHILFRNTEFNLDKKTNYYRVDNNKMITNIDIDFNSIDDELKEVFKFINDVPGNSFDGFTKAIIIFLQILIIQPYQKFNISLAILMSLWFLHKDGYKEDKQLRIFDLANQWEDMILKINEAALQGFNLSEAIDFIKSKIKESVKSNFLLSLIYSWIDEDYAKRSAFFPTDYEYIVLTAILTERTKEISITKITDKLRINNSTTIKKQEIKNALENLKGANILKTTKNETNYTVVDKQLNKYKYILK
ncbi:hypothetical protein CK556_03365 [Mesoplasma chauliocola]|uniref:Fido domain-containing protein n=1 Tax=Mesoplasma chauliocola TaxID=216427 RepID=A0A249SP16_9MOLU|nr:hypothetical protein [Mesoplasma chauliocola]ASZ09367.1 hypothetical protein CK556_03365 [Mesoplasma chauliocola]